MAFFTRSGLVRGRHCSYCQLVRIGRNEGKSEQKPGGMSQKQYNRILVLLGHDRKALLVSSGVWWLMSIVECRLMCPFVLSLELIYCMIFVRRGGEFNNFFTYPSSDFTTDDVC
jgi:hypothetical protein